MIFYLPYVQEQMQFGSRWKKRGELIIDNFNLFNYHPYNI